MDKNIIINIFATLTSKILGVVKARVFSSIFGASYIADAINFAFKIPNSFRKIVAEGSLTYALMPVINEDIINKLLTFLILLFSAVFVLVTAFSYEIIEFFSQFDHVTNLISASLLPYFIIFLFLISFSCIFTTILQKNSRFLIKSIAPLFFTITLIWTMLDSKTPESFGIGVIRGGLVQLTILYFAIRRYKLKLRLNFNFFSPNFKLFFRDFIKASGSTLITIVGFQITYYLASGLVEGSVTALDNSLMFYQLLFGVLVVSVIDVYYPKFLNFGKQYLPEALENIFALVIPGSIAMYFLAEETIAVILLTGQFTLDNTLVTASLLKIYVMGIIFSASLTAFIRYYMANKKYNTYLITNLALTILDLTTTIILIKNGMGAKSIPIGFIVSYLIILIYYISITKIDYKALSKKIAKIIIVNIPLFVLFTLYNNYKTSWYYSGSNLINLLSAVALYLGAIVITLVLYYIFNVDFIFKKKLLNK